MPFLNLPPILSAVRKSPPLVTPLQASNNKLGLTGQPSTQKC